MSQSDVNAAVDRLSALRKRGATVGKVYAEFENGPAMREQFENDTAILADAYLSQHAAIATDEVSAAIARLEEHHERGRFWGTHYYPVPGVPDKYFSGISDVGTVIEFAKRVLSRHAGDDGEITGEKLVAIGWEDKSERDWPRFMSPDSDRCGPTVRIMWEPVMGCDSWRLDSALIPPMNRMSQVFDLMRGLGIPLK